MDGAKEEGAKEEKIFLQSSINALTRAGWKEAKVVSCGG